MFRRGSNNFLYHLNDVTRYVLVLSCSKSPLHRHANCDSARIMSCGQRRWWTFSKKRLASKIKKDRQRRKVENIFLSDENPDKNALDVQDAKLHSRWRDALMTDVARS